MDLHDPESPKRVNSIVNCLLTLKIGDNDELEVQLKSLQIIVSSYRMEYETVRRKLEFKILTNNQVLSLMLMVLIVQAVHLKHNTPH